jgi:hypothetical protein
LEACALVALSASASAAEEVQKTGPHVAPRCVLAHETELIGAE